MPRRVGRVHALINPWMLKELRQSLHSRGLMAMGGLALLAPLLGVMSVLLYGVDRLVMEDAGEWLFGRLAGCIGLIAWLLFPAHFALQCHTEAKTRALDLGLVTWLSPWQLVSGKLQAAALQLVLLLTFTAPFALACSAFGGFDSAVVPPALLCVFMLGVVQASAAMLAVTAGLALPQLGALLLSALLVLQPAHGYQVGSVMLELLLSHGGAAEISWIALLLLILALFFARLCADLLTPPALRSYLRAKLLLVLFCAAFVAPWSVTVLFESRPWDGEEVLAAPLALASISGLLFCAAGDRGARRGWLGFLIADQREGHVCFICGLLLGCAASAALLRWPPGTSLAVLVYFVFYAGIASLLQSFTPQRGPESYLIMLGVLAFATYVGTLVYELPPRGHGMDYPPDVTVFLPTVWLGYGEYLRATSAAPLAIGAAALVWGRRRRQRLGDP